MTVVCAVGQRALWLLMPGVAVLAAPELEAVSRAGKREGNGPGCRMGFAGQDGGVLAGLGVKLGVLT